MFETILAVCAKIDPQVGLIIAGLLFFILLLVRVINADNPIEWWHFISTRSIDGNQYADIDKLGKVVGIIISSMIMLSITHQGKMDALLLGVYLAFVGGVAGYSAYLRSKTPPVIETNTSEVQK